MFKIILLTALITCHVISCESSSAQHVHSRVKRVIGGDLAKVGEFPYLASIKAKFATKKFLFITVKYTQFYCGAALIGDRWLITAAHCVYPQSGEKTYNLTASKYWNVRLSAVNLKASMGQKMKHWIGKLIMKKSWWLREYKVNAIYTHPEYKSSNIANDIALIELKNRVPFWESTNLGLVSLPPSNASSTWPGVGTRCRFVGWGCQEKGGSVSKKAYKITLPIIDDSACYRVFGQRYIQQDDFCAGYFGQGKSICQGDSGGGLVCDYEGRSIIAGIASAVHSERPGQYPAIFTRVRSHLKWINAIMHK